MNLLFVCTGNTCRSCMAEAIAKHKYNNLNIDIASAGIYAVKGDSASLNASNAMGAMGINVSTHVANLVTLEILQNSDLILTMTLSHKETLKGIYPQFGHKIFTLLEFIGKDGDINDPFGGNIEVYAKCANEIDLAIDKVFEKLKESRAY